jgi:N-methylhydantoinase A
VSAVVGIDVGGTFTDVIALDEGRLRSAKTPTTPGRLVDGILASLRALELELAEVSVAVHGSTTCTNALIEGKQARTGFVGTQGFTDEFDIQRMVRRWAKTPWAAIYDLHQRKPDPFVPRHLRREVGERMTYTGEVVAPLDPAELRACARELQKESVEAVAVCFLWSPANPAHEVEAAQLLAELHPGWHVSTSTEVAPVVREYERMVTTAVNASLMPLYGSYLRSVEAELAARGFAGELLLMQSNGGVARPAALAPRPVSTLNSGPVGGAVAAAWLARQLERRHVVACDIGGTSTDTTVIVDYAVPWSDATEVAYYPVVVPTADIRSIGAGGGSVATLDAGGALRVGPESMGASPGPACYLRGGDRPTLTDANVVLGRLDPDALAAEGVALSVEAARESLMPLAGAFEGDVVRAAHAVVMVAVANAAQSVRLQTIDRGLDPRGFSLLAFGGAGPLHATLIAEAAAIPEVVIPVEPGVFSSLGMLVADRRACAQAGLLAPLAEIEPAALEARYRELEQNARAILGERNPAERVVRTAAMRYVLQEWELRVPVPEGPPDPAVLAAAFHEAHRRRYGFAREDRPTELVTLYVDVMLPAPDFAYSRPGDADGDPRPGLRAELPVYTRAALRPGDRVAGPSIVEEPTSTTYLSPGWTAEVDALGNLIARKGS